MSTAPSGTSPSAPGNDAAGLTDLAGFVGSTTVDGVPVLLAPRRGDVTAGLVFRVGRADETLATSGITHLVEHLALFDQNLTEVHSNGLTADTYTLFHVTGTPDEVVRFLGGVCSALRDLPTDRLEVERGILRTEAAGRSGGPARAMRVWRYGARGYGLAGYDELGAARVTAEDVRAWARERFTRDNCVLFLTDDRVPPGLAIDLPAGTRFATPAPTTALPTTPASFVGQDGSIVLDAVVPRTAAATAFAQVAGRALFRDLRQDGGYSYTADADYTPRDGEHATITLYADTLPDQQDAAVGAFVDTMARLRAGRIEQDELDVVRSRMLRELDAPELAAQMLPGYALSLLYGRPLEHPDHGRAEIEALSVDDLRAVAREVWSDALVQVPARTLEWAGLDAAPSWSEAVLVGRRFPRAGSPVFLVVADVGVSLVTPQGASTVLFDECEVMTCRPDGARFLTGADGFTVPVEPTLHPGLTRDVVATAIDARVRADVVVNLPARDPDVVPRPPDPSAPTARVRTALADLGARARGWLAPRFGYVVRVFVGVSALVVWLLGRALIAAGEASTTDLVVVLTTAIALAAIPWIARWWLRRELRR